MSILFLKIKLKSLEAEAKIIRKHEQRAIGQIRTDLHEHRVRVVRKEARSTHLAYGFLRGRSLSQIEANSNTKPDWDSVSRMVKKYGPYGSAEGLKDWLAPPADPVLPFAHGEKDKARGTPAAVEV